VEEQDHRAPIIARVDVGGVCAGSRSRAEYPGSVAYSTAEAQTEMLDDIGATADELSGALAALSEAYELLDEDAADELERAVFAPVQAAYGRLRRTHTEFAQRHRLPARRFAPGTPGTHSGDPRVYIERGVDAAQDAEQRLAELQDSMAPVDVGDTELRAGLAHTRTLLADVPASGDRLLRAFGR
jgi:hypothetical protein